MSALIIYEILAFMTFQFSSHVFQTYTTINTDCTFITTIAHILVFKIMIRNGNKIEMMTNRNLVSGTYGSGHHYFRVKGIIQKWKLHNSGGRNPQHFVRSDKLTGLLHPSSYKQNPLLLQVEHVSNFNVLKKNLEMETVLGPEIYSQFSIDKQ